jgi:hypothetical protein
MGVINFSGFVGSLGLAGWLGKKKEEAEEGEATGGGDDEPVDWVPVATAQGVEVAHLIAGRLNSEGIPTRISQEAAGAAIGLSVGLGQIHVLVPEPLEARAVSILRAPVTLDEDEWEDDGEEAE